MRSKLISSIIEAAKAVPETSRITLNNMINLDRATLNSFAEFYRQLVRYSFFICLFFILCAVMTDHPYGFGTLAIASLVAMRASYKLYSHTCTCKIAFDELASNPNVKTYSDPASIERLRRRTPDGIILRNSKRLSE